MGFSKENYVESNVNSFKAEINDKVYEEITSILDNFNHQTKKLPQIYLTKKFKTLKTNISINKLKVNRIS